VTAAIGLDGRYLDPHHPGIGRYVYELARALPTALDGIELKLLLGPGPSDRFDLDALLRAGVRLVSGGGPARSPLAPWRLRHQVRSLGVDLWHAPYFATAFGPACPRVVTVYDAIGVLDPTFLPSLGHRLLYRLSMRAALAGAEHVITLSATAAQDLVSRFGLARERLAIIPAGVAESFRPATAEAVAALRHKLALPPRYALFLGTDRPHKNLAGLRAVWSRLRAAGETAGVTLVLAGFPRPRATRAPQAAGVIYAGPVAEADLATLLSAAELFIMPSLAEGFGLPLLEAMACGVPVACSSAGSLPEVAADAALFFDPRDSASMAEAITGLLRDAGLRSRLRAAGRARAAAMTWARTAQATAAVYRTLLAGA